MTLIVDLTQVVTFLLQKAIAPKSLLRIHSINVSNFSYFSASNHSNLFDHFSEDTINLKRIVYDT